VIRLAIRVRRADAEIVLAELLELAPSGVEERDLREGIVELAVYGAPGELPELPDLRAAAGEALVEVSSATIEEDWEERWKRFHRLVSIASPAPELVPGVCVRPPWEEASSAAAGELELEIEPGRAFGTGAHVTTRLCLELLLALSAELGDSRKGTSLCDLGTGSGVLAIAAAKLGYRPVWALDNDPLSVTAAQRNAKVNGVSVEVELFDLRRDQPARWAKTGGASVLVANLLRPLLLDLAGLIERPPGHLIASGLLRGEADETARAFAERTGLRERTRRESGEWSALWLVRER
jgi:ribosomal protein L11 methyltransferase